MGDVVELFKEAEEGEYPNDIIDDDETFWRCNCGSCTFYLTRDGAKCTKCGVVSSQWAEM